VQTAPAPLPDGDELRGERAARASGAPACSARRYGLLRDTRSASRNGRRAADPNGQPRRGQRRGAGRARLAGSSSAGPLRSAACRAAPPRGSAQLGQNRKSAPVARPGRHSSARLELLGEGKSACSPIRYRPGACSTYRPRRVACPSARRAAAPASPRRHGHRDHASSACSAAAHPAARRKTSLLRQAGGHPDSAGTLLSAPAVRRERPLEQARCSPVVPSPRGR
jgi:hypothetical protein